MTLWWYFSMVMVALTVVLCVVGVGWYCQRALLGRCGHTSTLSWQQRRLWLYATCGGWLWQLLPWRWRHRLPLWLGMETAHTVQVFLGRLLCSSVAVGGLILAVTWRYTDDVKPFTAVLGMFCTLLLPWWQRYQARQQRLYAQRCQYPFFLDVLALSVESGAGVMLALQTAAESLPTGDLQRLLQQALFRIRSGMSREQSFERLSQESGLIEIAVLSANVDNAVKMGLSLGTVLRAQADQYRQERFLRAEKKALEAPVKMLFPVVSCILPCTFLVIAFPLVMQVLQGLF